MLALDGIPVDANESPAQTLKVEDVAVGWNGYFKVGEWTRLGMTVTSPSDVQATLFVEAPDADDNLTTLPSRPVHLHAGKPAKIETCFKTGRIRSDINFYLKHTETGAILHSQRLRPDSQAGSLIHPGLHLDEPLRVTLGKPKGFDGESVVTGGNAAALEGTNPAKNSGIKSETDSTGIRNAESGIIHLQSTAQLPTDWRGYASLDVLVLAAAATNDQKSPLDDLTVAQDAALREWVQMGGHLILSVGSGSKNYVDSLLAKWVPVPTAGLSPLRQLPGLESFSGRHFPLTFAGTLQVTKITEFPAVVLVREIDGPIVVRAPFGFGRVTFLALDLNRSPLADWGGLPALCQRLIGDSRSEVRSQAKQHGQLSHLGVSDLASQLQAAQDGFTSVKRLSYWSVMGFILLYLIVIGPLDYVVVHHWLGRPELTWITFPVLVCLGAAVSVWGANRVNGNELQVNQTTLLDVESESKILRGYSWATLYSPETRRFNVAVEPQGFAVPADRDMSHLHLSWVGAPESTVGGLYRSGGMNIGGRAYAYTPDATAIESLPVQKWSTKGVGAGWHGATEKWAESKLESPGVGRLSGAVTHHLPFPLEDCMLVFGGRVYFPLTAGGTLAPFQEWEPGGFMAKQRELKGYLTGMTAQRVEKTNSPAGSTEIQFKTETYNPQNHDRTDLVRMLSFYHVADGPKYTGLSHTALRELELSSLMHAGRAILLGRIPASVAAQSADVRIDGQSQKPVERTSFVRVILPVKIVSEGEVQWIPKLSETATAPKKDNP